MGSDFSFSVQRGPPDGSIVKIVHDKFSYTAGTDDVPIPNDLMKIGTEVKALKTVNLFQSRDIYEPITVTKVMFRDGTTDVYLTKNLAPIKK